VESVVAVADQPDAAVEGFEPCVAQAEPDRGEHAGFVFAIARASSTNGLSFDRGAHASHASSRSAACSLGTF
jgi:hypothetical protein